MDSLSGQKNIATLLKTAEEINDAKNKDNYINFLQILQNLIHDIWVLRLGESAEKIINADVQSKLSRLAENFESQKLAKWMTEIELLRENLAVNLNKKIATDALFMQMAN